TSTMVGSGATGRRHGTRERFACCDQARGDRSSTCDTDNEWLLNNRDCGCRDLCLAVRILNIEGFVECSLDWLGYGEVARSSIRTSPTASRDNTVERLTSSNSCRR